MTDDDALANSSWRPQRGGQHAAGMQQDIGSLSSGLHTLSAQVGAMTGWIRVDELRKTQEEQGGALKF